MPKSCSNFSNVSRGPVPFGAVAFAVLLGSFDSAATAGREMTQSIIKAVIRERHTFFIIYTPVILKFVNFIVFSLSQNIAPDKRILPSILLKYQRKSGKTSVFSVLRRGYAIQCRFYPKNDLSHNSRLRHFQIVRSWFFLPSVCS